MISYYDVPMHRLLQYHYDRYIFSPRNMRTIFYLITSDKTYQQFMKMDNL